MNDKATSPHDLHRRRQEVIAAIKSGNYTPEEDQFKRSEIDRILGEDNKTTTDLLNKIASENHYLRRVSTGGSPILVANKSHDEDETATSASDQERLARKLVNEEGIDLTPEDYHWTVDESRQKFANKFNSQSNGTYLNPTWTANNYVVTAEGAEQMRDLNEEAA